MVEHTDLACTCGQPHCAGATSDDHVTKNAVVYVIAEQKTLDAAHAAETQQTTTAEPTEQTTTEPTSSPAPAEESAPSTAPPAYVFGAAVMPAPLPAATLERATIREVGHPGPAPPQPRYIPSRALCEFIRCET